LPGFFFLKEKVLMKVKKDKFIACLFLFLKASNEAPVAIKWERHLLTLGIVGARSVVQ